MNKLEFVSILQTSLLNFDDCSAEEIRKLNPQFTEAQIRTGIEIVKILKGEKQKWNQNNVKTNFVRN